MTEPPPTRKPESLRVLMIGKGWFPEQTGGLDRYFRDLFEQLPEARAVVVGGQGIVHTDRVRTVSSHDRPLPLRLLALTRVIRKEARDASIIDAHFALYAFLPMLLGAFRGTPVVVHFQGPWADENVESGDKSRWRLRLRRALERYVYRRATLAITLTGAFKQGLVERYGVSPWRVKVLAPGVDLERFGPGDRAAARERFLLPSDAFVVCCARRLVPRMGLGVLLDAWSQLLADDSRAASRRRSRLLIAGDGELRVALGEQIVASGIEDSVELLGRISDDALADLYRAADVNVVPSLSFEGFGLVVLEAAASGTPTIATRVGGLPEALAGFEPSLIVAPGDPSALAQRLATAERRDLPDRDSTRAWAERHRWDLVAERHRALYAGALSGPPADQRKIRVAYVGHVAQLSGGEIALARLIDALDEVDAHVILAEDGPLVARLLASGTSVEVLPMRERTRDLRKDRVGLGLVPIAAVLDTVIYTFRLARRLRMLRPDIVHTNTLKAGVYGSLAGRLARLPVVWHVRDRIASDYLRRLAVPLLRALIASLPDAVIANSEATRKTLRSAPEVTRVVYSVVHDPIAGPLAPAWRNVSEPFVVGMIGRLAPWKGQHVFLEAFATAFGTGDETAVLVGEAMFGEDEADYAVRLREMTQTLGIADRVEFRGFSDDVWAELAKMSVCVHASVVPEPFGQVVVEAMLAGVPVIATEGGGPSEIVTDDEDGLLYPAGDVDALVDALRRLRHDVTLRARLITNARVRAERFSSQDAEDAVMSLYHTVLRNDKQDHDDRRLDSQAAHP
jgi:glycosyltransferase involved in cell wall biosynthesis